MWSGSPDKYVARILGSQGKTKEEIMLTTSCSIKLSQIKEYHPMATEQKGREVEIEGVSKAGAYEGAMAVIEAAVKNQPEKPGLCLATEGVLIAVPTDNTGAVMGEEGGEHRRLIEKCGLAQLQLGKRPAPGEGGERLLLAVGGKDAIRSLVREILTHLGVSPSGYVTRVQKRKRDDDDSEVAAGHGNQVRGSRKKLRNEQNIKNKVKHTKSKKEKHLQLQMRQKTNKAQKNEFKAWKSAGGGSGFGRGHGAGRGAGGNGGNSGHWERRGGGGGGFRGRGGKGRGRG